MITRKVESEIEYLKNNGTKMALLLDGARQVGKTFVVRHCASRHYKQFIEINFIETPEARTLMRVGDFSLEKARVYGDFSDIETGSVSYYPIYALMFLKHDPLPERMVYPLPL